LTPLAAAALAVGGTTTAHAAKCIGFGSASIKPLNGTVTAGSSVGVSATVRGMLLQAHLQISGPGLDQQVGKSASNGEIADQITVPQSGYFTLAVIGNGTGCTYETSGFSVKERPSSPKPTPHNTPGKTLAPGGGGFGTPDGPTFPAGNPGNAGNTFSLKPLNGSSPFSLPSVAPEGSDPGFAYPSPDPQIASPPAKPLARNVSETTPIRWGQSVALALVLLMLSAHLGMLSRRQRLATAGARPARGGRAAVRKKTRRTAAAVADASTPSDAAADAPARPAPGRTYQGRRRRHS
jgi:hypothetical protein